MMLDVSLSLGSRQRRVGPHVVNSTTACFVCSGATISMLGLFCACVRFVIMTCFLSYCFLSYCSFVIKKLLHFVIHISMKNFKKERHSVRNKHSRFMFSPIVRTHGILRFVPTMVLYMGGCFICNFK